MGSPLPSPPRSLKNPKESKYLYHLGFYNTLAQFWLPFAFIVLAVGNNPASYFVFPTQFLGSSFSKRSWFLPLRNHNRNQVLGARLLDIGSPFLLDTQAEQGHVYTRMYISSVNTQKPSGSSFPPTADPVSAV